MTNANADEDAKDRERYSELAERLAAAWISHQQGLASVDYVLKKYVRGQEDPIGRSWIELAKHVDETMSGSIGKMLTVAQKPHN